MPSRIDEAGHTKAFGYPVAEHWGENIVRVAGGGAVAYLGGGGLVARTPPPPPHTATI